MHVDPEKIPHGGVHRGRDGAKKFFQVMALDIFYDGSLALLSCQTTCTPLKLEQTFVQQRLSRTPGHNLKHLNTIFPTHELYIWASAAKIVRCQYCKAWHMALAADQPDLPHMHRLAFLSRRLSCSISLVTGMSLRATSLKHTGLRYVLSKEFNC